jgi:hypothetical protein
MSLMEITQEEELRAYEELQLQRISLSQMFYMLNLLALICFLLLNFMILD